MGIERSLQVMEERRKDPEERKRSRKFGAIGAIISGSAIILNHLISNDPSYAIDGAAGFFTLEGICDMITGRHHYL